MSDFSGDNRPFSGGLPPAPPPPPPNMAPPPGYVSYGAQQGSFGAFQRVGGLGKAIGVIVLIVIPLLVIAQIVQLGPLRSTADDFVNGDASTNDFNAILGLFGLISILSALLQLTLLILTMIWMNRMAKNNQLMNRVGTWTPGWAIGAWFLPPCVIYVLPYLMLRDLWKASDPESTGDWQRNPVSPIVHIWWALFGLVPMAFVTVSFGSFNLNTGEGQERDAAEKLLDVGAVSALAGIVQIAAAVAFLLLVRQLTARHKFVTNEI